MQSKTFRGQRIKLSTETGTNRIYHLNCQLGRSESSSCAPEKGRSRNPEQGPATETTAFAGSTTAEWGNEERIQTTELSVQACPACGPGRL